MRRPVTIVALAAVAALVMVLPVAARDVAPGRGLAEQLRYIGRDWSTGFPSVIDDRFIADVERSVERYGQDETEPVPPPPPDDAPGGRPVDITRLHIPALGVDAPVGRYGIDAYGRLDVPQDSTTVGWNPGFAALPGTGGATFLAAHYEYGGVPGVFFRLSSLDRGDEVALTLDDGSEHRYRVTSVVDYGLGAIDMGALLAGREGIESITLMTCSGPQVSHGYALRTVVLAERIAP